ncbi:MAG: integrase/recombinase XerD [Chloroflexota bacterium]|nr:integrase/recombinase XerD [Chloroflexota bacterium]
MHRQAPSVVAQGELAQRIGAYLRWMEVRNYAQQTIAGRRFYLERFRFWSTDRGVHQVSDVGRDLLADYQYHVHRSTTISGAMLSVRSQYLHLQTLRGFFRWAVRHGAAPNAGTDIELPRLERRLPRDILTHAEVEAVMRQPNLLDPLGLRDRAILEVFYSTAIRRLELTQLSLTDLNRGSGTLSVRHGKGGRDRVIPIGSRAVSWVDRYLVLVRPLLVRVDSGSTLFLTKRGDALDPGQLSAQVARYIDAAGVGKRGSCHVFRHTCATLMLEGGADIRFIQAMLGHASLASTQIYTHVSIRRLKEVHSRTHPGAAESPRAMFEPVGALVAAQNREAPGLSTGWKRPYLVSVGRHLKELRELRGLTREGLAQRTGSTRGHIRKLEDGVHPPRPELVARLAAALAVEPAELVPNQATGAHLAVTVEIDGSVDHT